MHSSQQETALFPVVTHSKSICSATMMNVETCSTVIGHGCLHRTTFIIIGVCTGTGVGIDGTRPQ